MEAELERHSTFVLLRFKGDLRLWNRPEVEQRLLASLQSGLEGAPSQVVLSLSGVTSIDTSGIAALVRVPIECARRNLELKVVMPPGMPGEALRRVKIFDYWPNFPEESSAVEPAA